MIPLLLENVQHNKGNDRALLQMGDDKNLIDDFENKQLNDFYLSTPIQNNFIEILGKIIHLRKLKHFIKQRNGEQNLHIQLKTKRAVPCMHETWALGSILQIP